MVEASDRAIDLDPVIHSSTCRCGRCRRRWAQTCDGSGTDPRCGTLEPHAHCVCYLPMKPDAKMCELCESEGLVPSDYDEMVWDGKSYPSFRRHRTMAPHPILYVTMFRVAWDMIDSRINMFQ